MDHQALKTKVVRVCLICACLALPTIGQQQQAKISKFERDEVLQMLDTVSNDVKKHYYDPKLRSIDWDANIKDFHHRIEDAASLNHGMSEVAAALDKLNDLSCSTADGLSVECPSLLAF